jgi:hypothetical protein
MTAVFRAPNAKVLRDLKQLFEQVGQPISPYGSAIISVDDVFDLIEKMHGLDAASRCVISVTYH